MINNFIKLNNTNKNLKIAVIGSGISGLSAAWLLSKKHEVTLFEENDYVGGHSKTISVNYDNKDYDLDVGFIVHNDINYPNFVQLLNYFNIPTETSNMSFSVSVNNGEYEYSSTLPVGPFIQPSNLFKKKFLKMIFEIPKFYFFAKKFDFRLTKKNIILDEFLKLGNFSKFYSYDHLFPMASAIWSQPINKVMKFDAESFVKFYESHGLLRFSKRPKWKIIKGGSIRYIEKILNNFSGKLILNANISSISRRNNQIKIIRQKEFFFDQVVFAIHPEKILKLLNDCSEDELSLLKKFKSEKNLCFVHSDEELMPKRERAWSSWNYFSDKSRGIDSKVFVTYWLNKLQNINSNHNFLLTLNPVKEPSSKKIFTQFEFSHPIYSVETVNAQTRIQAIQGNNNTWFCGAWNGFGFHEDGLCSGIKIAEAFGCKVPWVKN